MHLSQEVILKVRSKIAVNRQNSLAMTNATKYVEKNPSVNPTLEVAHLTTPVHAD